MATDPSRFVYIARSSAATVALLRYLTATTKPTVVWSQWKGYLRKGGPVPRFCSEHGIRPQILHSGGHAHPEDLSQLVARLQPKAVVPIHTEAASQFAAIMPNVRIVNDGDQTDIASLFAARATPPP